MSETPQNPADAAKATRAARLAKELRANLARRKAQSRSRAEAGQGADTMGAGPQDNKNKGQDS
ncbi:hypothetical protein [Phaeovulum sp.]|uniref:hypothetical protein n=1 Tax=Phaeovulum sp. TaxID=2934796 RepID=UPI00356A6A43